MDVYACASQNFTSSRKVHAIKQMYLQHILHVCTDQQAISQDWPTENVFIVQQEISEEWPTKESFKKREILKWRNISDDVYKIKKVSHRESKYGISAILTLKTKCGDERLVWAPKRLAEDLEDDSYQFVYKIGLKTTADGNEYFDYELM